MSRNHALLALLSLTLISCRERPPAEPPAPDPEVLRLPLGERLAREANARPPGAVRVEQVLSALERGGITVARRRQVLATTLGAAYCASAVTTTGVALSLCEYPAADVARRGLEYSRRTFDRLIPDRRLLVNGQTLLTVTPAATAEARAAAAIFAAL